MKKLQNNFTTPEQSKRLLELGVPADSADMYYKHTQLPPCVFSDTVLFSVYSDVEDITPCWSVGRLMEIIRICNLTDEKPWVYIEQDNVSAMIHAIIDGANNSMFDFSKLEDRL